MAPPVASLAGGTAARPAPERAEGPLPPGRPCGQGACVHLRRVEPERNMQRWYTLSVEVTLWGDWSCTRAFGRIGRPGGRVMLGLYETEAAAERELQALLARKRRRGYREAPPSSSDAPPAEALRRP